MKNPCFEFGTAPFSEYDESDNRCLSFSGRPENFRIFSEKYRKRFQNGDEKAIYRFAAQFPECFRATDPGTASSWVVRQIEKWRMEGTPESRKKLRRFFYSYATGSPVPKSLSKEEEEIVSAICSLTDKGMGLKEAIWTFVFLNVDSDIDPELRSILNKHIMNNSYFERIIARTSEITGVSVRKLRKYVEESSTLFEKYELYFPDQE